MGLPEAAYVIVRHRHHPSWKTKHVCQIYDQVPQRTGHAIAVSAVGSMSRRLPSGYSPDHGPTGRLPSGRPLSSRCMGVPNLYPLGIRQVIAWRPPDVLMLA